MSLNNKRQQIHSHLNYVTGLNILATLHTIKILHSAERYINPPFLFHSSISLETCNPPPFVNTHHGKIPDSMMIHQNQGD